MFGTLTHFPWDTVLMIGSQAQAGLARHLLDGFEAQWDQQSKTSATQPSTLGA